MAGEEFEDKSPVPIVLPGRSNSFVFPSRFHLVSPRLFHFKRLFRLCSRLTCRSPVPPPSLQTPALLHVFCPFTSSRTLFLFSISHHLFYFKKFSMAARAVLGRRSTGTHLLHPTRQVRSSSSAPRIRSNSNVRACDQSPSPSQVRGGGTVPQKKFLFASPRRRIWEFGLNGSIFLLSLQRPPQSGASRNSSDEQPNSSSQIVLTYEFHSLLLRYDTIRVPNASIYKGR